jgi:hypothetical protein
MLWIIGPVIEYEAQSKIIHFVGIIIQEEHVRVAKSMPLRFY